jgi:AraC-like DNA-binding protein
VCSTIFTAFEEQVREYFRDGHSEQSGIPTVAYFAQRAHLSTSYFGDLIKKEAGVTAQSYIQDILIGQSKQLLLEGSLTINEIAYQLGFQYPQHFTRLFKNKVGITPNQYRRQAI